MATPPRNIPTRTNYPVGDSGQVQPAQIPSARPLTPSEFNTALVHLYRGEVSRANTWRTRLDGTTNWAVLTTGATLSFAFSSPNNTHVMILLNSLLIGFFLFIEARRYRYYDLWRTRVRLMETEFFSDLLVPNSTEATEEHWRELLASDLLHPHFTMSLWEAVGRRLRRNYSWVFAVLVLSWIVKVGIHPFPTTDLAELIRRAGVGPISGITLIVVGIIFNGLLIALALATMAPFGRLKFSSEVPTRAETRQQMGETERNWWE
ncbi:MAG: DUF2270 domain-containing protein [Chloroflexota bacterium]|nr:DUF2270 domain-containing protein [Chloroflexota bacterium]